MRHAPAGRKNGLRRFLDPPVVRHVDDERIVRQPLAVDEPEELSARLVEPLAHGVIAGQRFLPTRLRILVEETLRWIVGRVRQKRRVPDKKRLGVGLLRGLLDEVEDGLSRLNLEIQVHLTPSFS